MSLSPTPTLAGECTDPNGVCTEPCPAENSCVRHKDCPEGQVCAQACLPSWCGCYVQYETWACSDDCAGECVDWFGPDGPLSYMIIDLGTLGGSGSAALAVNNMGQVVGQAGAPDGTMHAFLWENGVMTDLHSSDLVRSWSIAVDINNHCQVIINRNSAVFLWEDGETIPLGSLYPGYFTTGYALNDAGQAVGCSGALFDYDQRVFLWADGVMTDLGTLGGPAPCAWDINVHGQVVGTTGRAFLWENGVVTTLGTLGGEFGGAAGINNAGQAVGLAELPPDDSGESVVHAFFWEDGVMTDLGLLATLRHSAASAINNAGQVVGETNEPGVHLGFLYDSEHGMRNLRDLLPLDGPWRYWYELRPRNINDAGQIVGTATFNGLARAFLMTPIDADFDNDDDTDLLDFTAFRACLTGPDNPVEDKCRPYDINRNGTIDLVDLRAFQWVFSGGS